MSQVRILTVGLEASARALLTGVLNSCSECRMDFDLEKLMEPSSPPPHAVLCGPPPGEISLIEVAQTLRMVYTEIPIHFVSFARVGYDRKVFVKNGFSEAFLLPMDLEFLRRDLTGYLSTIAGGGIQSYRSVKLVDIQPGTVLDFDTAIYLPANDRYIKYSCAGDAFDEEKVNRLKRHNMSAVYVPADQMQKFYQYTARRLGEIGVTGELSATEKNEKLETAIRDLVSGLFSDSTNEMTFDAGKKILEDLKGITSAYILNSPSSDWYQRLLGRMGEMGSDYNHSANVSTYAALFSIGLGIGDPAELAMAGLLHDVGLADIPHEVLEKNEEDRTKEGQALYEKHPLLSLEILRRKKLVLSDKVSKMISQHHECFNGTGYPGRMVGSRILKEAQLLALADKFDYLTSASQGNRLTTPAAAIQYLRRQVIDDPGKMIFDPELLKAVLRLFPKSQESDPNQEVQS